MTKSASWDKLSPRFSENTAQIFKQLNQETQLEGERWFEEKRAVRPWQILFKAKLSFLYNYFLKGGIGKGYSGFMQAVYSLLYQLLSYAKYWELTERKRGKM